MYVSELVEAGYHDNYLTVPTDSSLMYDAILPSERCSRVEATSGTFHLPKLWGSLQTRSRGSRTGGGGQANRVPELWRAIRWT